jgi:hypothetical protein
MNRLSIFIAVQTLFVLLLVGCQKTDSVLNPQDTNPPTSIDSTMTLEEAQQIFMRQSDKLSHSRTAGDGEVNDKMDFEKRPLWNYATKEKFKDGTQVIITPLEDNLPKYPSAIISTQATLNQKAKTNAQVFTTHKAVVYKDKGKETVEIMSVIGEEDYKTKNTYFDNDQIFTGALLFHDLNNKFLRGFYYDKGKYIGRLDKPKKNGRTTGCYWTETVSVFYYTVSAGGIQYQSATPNSVTWVNLTLYCDDSPPYNPNMTTTNTNNSGGGSGSGSGSNYTAAATQAIISQLYVVARPLNIVKPIDHLKCFNNSIGSNYKVSLNIDQPVSNSGTLTNPTATGGHLVGHAYLVFEQELPNGQLIRRSIGFYPENGGNPINPSGPPAFNDDGQYTGGWDVQTTFTVTGSNMMAMIAVVNGYGNKDYDLYTRNCGNMCVDAFKAADIYLPTDWMSVSWGYRYGPSIGVFGQQMRNVQNEKILGRNNTGGIALPKNGTCN